MNPAKKAELAFMSWSKNQGLLHKVAGDNAYSSKAMGNGRYARMKSAKGDKVQIWYDGKYLEINV